MNETAAAQVLLLRAFETRGATTWTDDDRAWASRSALQAVGAAAPAEGFIAARAQLALDRLATRDPLVARWRGWRPWRAEWLLLAVVLGFAIGVLVDRIGSAQRINLLAPPVWAVIAWNLAVYVWLLGHALSATSSPGWLRRGVSAWLQRWRMRRMSHAGGAGANAWQAFAADWAAHSLPLNSARVALALHLGAAALGLGLIAGLYLRGLVLDYRVAWQSTFLDAATVHRLLSTLFAPASALSGIALPDLAGVAALRLPAGAPPAAASAAPWIHLYALQLAALVVLPRLALALWAGLRARRLQQHVALSLREPYFERLLWQQRGGNTPVGIWPHAHTPDAAAQAALKALFTRLFGAGLQLQLAPTVAYGAEDEPRAPGAEGALCIALFDLGATPEAESQGRLMRSLGAPALMLVDEAAFAQRFGAGSPRLPERRQAWSGLAASLGCGLVFVDLRAGDGAAAEAALQNALMRAPPA
ncbi:MAG TPA: DUF2868 domain-containing protein [Rubrivivax sp.]|jgi:hypothetical protein|nr:DUF2868 domain-containing protein [Rubrivivax sp.]